MVLASYLALVPDEAFFALTQACLLLHVGLGVATLAWVVARLTTHALQATRWLRRRTERGTAAAPREGRERTLWAVRWGAFGALVVCLISGLHGLYAGANGPLALTHEVSGLALAVAVVLHIVLDARTRRAAWVMGGTAAASAAVAFAVDLASRPHQTEAHDPGFEIALRPIEAYEEAAWCGECHGDIYAEWAVSTHGRALQTGHVLNDFPDNTANNERSLADIERFGADLDPLGGDEPCVACHAPLSFYGDDELPVLETDTVAAEGVTCAFCHTLRDVRPPLTVSPALEIVTAAAAEGRRVRGTDRQVVEAVAGPGAEDMHEIISVYTSAPESVSHYFGQADPSPLRRQLGNWMIRWRPDVHARDYRPSFLDTSEACRGCHGMVTGGDQLPNRTYDTWHAGPFNTPENARECQDCHMVEVLDETGAMPHGRVVNWGPNQPRRSHYFLGGNVHAAEETGDAYFVELERAFAQAGSTLEIAEVAARADGMPGLDVTIRVATPLNGHLYPAMESHLRLPCVSLTGLTAAGERLPLATCDDPHDAVGFIGRHADRRTRILLRDTAMLPDSERRIVFTLEPPPEPLQTLEAAIEHRLGGGPTHVVTRDL